MNRVTKDGRKFKTKKKYKEIYEEELVHGK